MRADLNNPMHVPNGVGLMINKTAKTLRLQWYKMGLEWGDYTLINEKGTIETGTRKQVSINQTIAVSKILC